MVFDNFKAAIMFAEAYVTKLKSERKTQLLSVDSWNEQATIEAKYLIGLVIGIYLLAALLPGAIGALNDTNTTGWTPTQIAIWGVLSFIILAVVIMKLAE